MSIRKLSADFTFYGLLDFLQKSIGIVMVPIYTRFLSRTEYGNLDIIVIAISVLCVLVDLQFVAGFTRLFYEHQTAGSGSRFVGTVILSRLFGGFAIAVLFISLGLLGSLEFDFLPSFKANTTAWLLAASLVPAGLSFDIFLLHTRMLRWKKLFAIGALSNTLLSCVFSALFVVFLDWGIEGVILGLLLGRLVSVFLLGCGLRKEIALCFDFSTFSDLLRYSLPLVPGWWFAFGSAYVSRFFVFAELGAAENAILALCMKVVSVIGLFSVSFQMAWQPLAMAYIGDESGETFYVRSMRLYIAGGLVCVFFLSVLIGPVMPILAPDSYNAVAYYFPLFAVGALLSGCANNLQLGNQIAKTTYWISISSVVSIAVNLFILIVFTKSHGISAAGLAWVVSFSVKSLIMYFTAQKSHHIPYDKKSFLLLGIGCGLLVMLALCRQDGHFPEWFFIASISVLGIIIPWFVMSPSERRAVFNFLRHKRGPSPISS